MKKKDEYFKVLLSNYFEIIEVIVDEINKQHILRLKIFHNGDVSEATVPSSTFSQKNIQDLRNIGICFNPYKIKDRLIEYADQQIFAKPKTVQHNKVGWYNEKNNLEFYGYDNEYIGDIHLSYSTDMEKQVVGLNSLIKNLIPCQLAVLIGLSSSIIGLLNELGKNIETPIFHFYGDSSTGKSTALFLAVSVWGEPVFGNDILQSWNATGNAIMNTLNNNHGVILALDESSVSNQEFTNLVYCISQGIEKSRLNKNSSKRTQRSWSTCVISSGENSIINNCKNYSGITARVIEFPNVSITNSAEHSDDIKQFCRDNYGMLGKRFVEIIQEKNLYETILNDYEIIRKRIEKLLTDSTAIDIRLCRYYAILALCARIAAKYLSLDIQEDKIIDYLVKNNSLESNQSLFERVYSYINYWVTSNPSAFFGEENIGTNKVGIIRKDTAFFFQESFIDILKKGNFYDYTVILKALKDNNRLYCEKDRLETRTTINNCKVNCYAVILDIEKNENVSMSKANKDFDLSAGLTAEEEIDSFI